MLVTGFCWLREKMTCSNDKYPGDRSTSIYAPSMRIETFIQSIHTPVSALQNARLISPSSQSVRRSWQLIPQSICCLQASIIHVHSQMLYVVHRQLENHFMTARAWKPPTFEIQWHLDLREECAETRQSDSWTWSWLRPPVLDTYVASNSATLEPCTCRDHFGDCATGWYSVMPMNSEHTSFHSL